MIGHKPKYVAEEATQKSQEVKMALAAMKRRI
jgi:hypothetical protein